MKFNPYQIDLPITEIIDDVKEKLINNSTLIVNAPPGAGKSTLLPLALLEEAWLKGKKILMLEPRRLAARTIALRMADLLGEQVAETVGYRIRFENRTSERTAIEVLTEGILTRMLQSDKTLRDVGMVVFDEFHERSIFADVALALCREAQRTHRPDLRIMVMSATLNMPQLTRLLEAPVSVSQGRQYPVEIKYTGDVDEIMLPEMTCQTVVEATTKYDGDVLVFLPGEADIRNCEEILKKKLRNFVIHPLYGQLPPSKQYSAIMPNKQGKRKIVLATSIAETSLTIEGVKVVVDTGYGKISRFDPVSGLSRLQTVRISKDSADQRAGRAGRLSAGTCFRMWTKESHQYLQEHRIPEIVEADLSSLVLDMAQWGIFDIENLTWLTPPPRANLKQAIDTLNQLGALKEGRITEHGKKMHSLPCHPRIAHMLLMAEDGNHLALATDIASLLEEKDPLPREAGIDINERIKALRRYRKENGQARPLGRIEKIAGSYRKLFQLEPDNTAVDPYETGILLAHCYPERIAFARPGTNARFQLANGTHASASHKDDLAKEPWLAVANLDARDGNGKIFLASPLNPKDLKPLVKEQVVIKWDTEDGELTASKDIRIGSIVLKSSPLPAPDERHLPRAISEAIQKEGETLLPITKEVKQWQKTILAFRKANPQDSWPDVSTASLLMTNSEWLLPYLSVVEIPEDLRKLNLFEILNSHFLDKDKSEILKLYLAKEKV